MVVTSHMATSMYLMWLSYVIIEVQKECLIKSDQIKNMYPLDTNMIMIIRKPQLWLLAKPIPDVSWLWHQRLALLNFWYTNDLVFDKVVWGFPLLKFENDHLFTACECGKQSKKGHPSKKSISKPLELPHIDLCGLSSIESLHHKQYILMFFYDYTWFTWVFFLILKSETPLKLIITNDSIVRPKNLKWQRIQFH